VAACNVKLVDLIEDKHTFTPPDSPALFQFNPYHLDEQQAVTSSWSNLQNEPHALQLEER
jgi:hypothetical protein